MTLGRKSQAFTTDFTTSVIIFIMVLVLIVFIWDQTTYDILKKEQLENLRWVVASVTEQLVRTPGTPPNWIDDPSNAALIGLTEDHPLKTTKRPSGELTYFVQDRLVDADKLFYLMYLSGNSYSLTRSKLLRLGNYHYFLELECLNNTGLKSCFGGQFFDKIKSGSIKCANKPDSHLRIRDQRFVYADYPPSLVSLWMFDEDYGRTAYDLPGENNGLIEGASYVDAYLGSALNFDGVDDYVDCGRDSSLYPSATGLSIEAWVKPDDRGGVIVEKANSADILYSISLTNSRAVEGRVRNNGAPPFSVVRSTTHLNPGTWYHVVYTIGTTQQKIYVDGRLDGQRDRVIAFPPDTSLPFKIGSGFNGSIDHVAVYNTSLSGAEVRDLFIEENDTIDSCVVGFYPYDNPLTTPHLSEVVPHEATVTLSKPLDLEQFSITNNPLLKPTLRLRLVVWTSDVPLNNPSGSIHVLTPP
ncbi:MAG: LamG domain-containing protein [Candidatus Altiarchaeota archaeon]|nr:LamG domain-containing protein [Candidatus Altiarchaeota archaeon]